MAKLTEAQTERALLILHRMTLENEKLGWRHIFSRWYYSAEPLRHDAANYLRSIGYSGLNPDGYRPVGDDYAALAKEPRT